MSGARRNFVELRKQVLFKTSNQAINIISYREMKLRISVMGLTVRRQLD